MSNLLYPLGKKALLDGSINMLSDTIKIGMVAAGYTYSAAHQFWSSVSANVVGTPATLANKTTTGGVFDADDVTFTTVTGSAVTQLVIYKDTGTGSTSPLIAFIDGVALVEIAAAANSGATTITPEDLPGAIANGATLTKVSGTGPSTIVTSASGAAGDRTLSVSALGSALSAGAVYSYPISGVGLPVTPNGGNISIPFAAAGIFAI